MTKYAQKTQTALNLSSFFPHDCIGAFILDMCAVDYGSFFILNIHRTTRHVKNEENIQF